MVVANTLAYYDMTKITGVKFFMVQSKHQGQMLPNFFATIIWEFLY